MLSSTVSQGSSSGCWNITAQRAKLLVMLPFCTSSSPAARRSSVVLPQPDGPTSATQRPGASRRLTGASA